MINTAYGSYELFFSYVPASNLSVTITTNVLGHPSFSEVDAGVSSQAISTKIYSELDVDTGLLFIVCETVLGTTVVDRSDFSCDSANIPLFSVRVFYFNARISVYMNNKWVYSYNLRKVEYPFQITSSLRVDGSVATVTNVNKVEIADGREAVFVDYESTSDNAISSIVQDRPIETYSAIGRAAQFTYDATKQDIGALFVNSYTSTESGQSSASSDGLVYSMDVGISNDEYVARELGLITRLYRLPDLDSGVERAVRAIQKKARQSRIRVDTTGRFDPRIEVSDVHVLDNVIITGTQRVVSDRVIVEDLSMSLSDGNYSQNLSGRRDVDGV